MDLCQCPPTIGPAQRDTYFNVGRLLFLPFFLSNFLNYLIIPYSQFLVIVYHPTSSVCRCSWNTTEYSFFPLKGWLNITCSLSRFLWSARENTKCTDCPFWGSYNLLWCRNWVLNEAPKNSNPCLSGLSCSELSVHLD